MKYKKYFHIILKKLKKRVVSLYMNYLTLSNYSEEDAKRASEIY